MPAREERTFVTMADGVRLAASLWLPDGDGPWPALLEARPYRKDDVTAAQRQTYRRLVDEGGYAVCRVDVRGTGSSEGFAETEYSAREHRDLVEVIAWLADRAWCTGSVGMWGKSYSGFNAFQLAMEQPPALKAICSIYASDSRYTDDVHYGGGIRRMLDFLDYPMSMVAMNALPPVPGVFGEGWHEEWGRRVSELVPWELRWFEEQDLSDYWRHGSVRGREDRVRVPTMIIAGQADGYHNVVFRALERIDAPVSVLFGPWSHLSPDAAFPGPRVDHVPLMIRWWDRWLRGEPNGVDAEPPLTVFMRRPTPPQADLDTHAGEWRAEPSWPPERLRERSMRLTDAGRAGSGEVLDGGRADRLTVRGDVGVTASIWCADALPWGLPWDQRRDEAFSLGYAFEPLDEEVEVLGHPRVELVVASSTPVAFAAVNLCDVFPDGTSQLVARGLLNLTHRHGHEDVRPLEPGRAERVEIELEATAWIFERGHRIRLDVAGSAFASSWPPPQAGTLTVEREGSRLLLPVLEGPPVADPPSLPPGEGHAEALDADVVWRVEEDLLAHETRVVVGYGDGETLEDGTRVDARSRGAVGVSTDDPGRAWARGTYRYELSWPEATVRAEARGELRSDATTWSLSIELDVSEDGEVRWQRRWDRTIPRHLQ
jgi:hypothetical protein